MKDFIKKYFAVVLVIVLVLALVVTASAFISKKITKKEEPSKIFTAEKYDPYEANVKKSGFTFKVLDKEVQFPLQMKEDLIDQGFTFMRYDEVKKVYIPENADTTVILENVDKNLSFGQSFFRAVVKDSQKPANSFEDTDVVRVIAEKTDKNIFTVNGYSCGDRMTALLNAFGSGYEVTSEKGTSAEEGVYTVEYKSGDLTVSITAEDGKIIAINAGMLEENN